MKSLDQAATYAVAAALGALLCGCRSIDSTAWNLRQLHEPDGSPRPVAAVMSGLEFGVRTSIGSLPGLAGEGSAVGPSAKPAGRVGSPRGRSLTELLALARYDASDFDARSVQAEIAGWLAIDSDVSVERLVAVRVLGHVAAQLGEVDTSAAVLDAVLLPSADGAAGTAPESAATVSGDGASSGGATDDRVPEALTALVRDLSTAARSGDATRVVALLQPWPPAEQGLAAARRLLRSTALLSHESSGRTATALRTAADHYARRVCGRALVAALADSNGEVRAEAHRQVVIVEPSRAFELADAAARNRDWPALEGVLRRLLQRGLPAGDEQGERFSAWLFLFVAHTNPDIAPEFVGALTTTACECLERFAPTRIRGLRPEVWADWYEDYSAKSAATNADATQAGSR